MTTGASMRSAIRDLDGELIAIVAHLIDASERGSVHPTWLALRATPEIEPDGLRLSHPLLHQCGELRLLRIACALCSLEPEAGELDAADLSHAAKAGRGTPWPCDIGGSGKPRRPGWPRAISASKRCGLRLRQNKRRFAMS